MVPRLLTRQYNASARVTHTHIYKYSPETTVGLTSAKPFHIDWRWFHLCGMEALRFAQERSNRIAV